MMKPAKISPSTCPGDALDIGSEREQLLVRTEQTGECTRRASPYDDGHSTQCQLCGRDDINPTPKQKCARILDILPAHLTLTVTTAVR